jgi:hypothetical protein
MVLILSLTTLLDHVQFDACQRTNSKVCRPLLSFPANVLQSLTPRSRCFAVGSMGAVG